MEMEDDGYVEARQSSLDNCQLVNLGSGDGFRKVNWCLGEWRERDQIRLAPPPPGLAPRQPTTPHESCLSDPTTITRLISSHPASSLSSHIVQANRIQVLRPPDPRAAPSAPSDSTPPTARRIVVFTRPATAHRLAGARSRSPIARLWVKHLGRRIQ